MKALGMFQSEGNEDDIRNVFQLYDVDNTGFISMDNLRTIARQLGEKVTEVRYIYTLSVLDKLYALFSIHRSRMLLCCQLSRRT